MQESDTYFCVHLLPTLFFCDFDLVHKKIFEALNSNYPLVDIIAPRKTGKTPITKFGYILKRIVFNLERYIIYCGESGEEAKRHVQQITKQLEFNERIHHYFGKFVDRKSLETQKESVQFTNGIQLKSRGTLQQMRGTTGETSPPTLIVVDDPQSNKTVKSDTMRIDAKNWLEEEVIYSLAKKWLHPVYNYIDRGKLRFIGTNLHPDSLAANCERDPRFYNVSCSALIDKNGLPDHINGKSSWELMHSTKELYAERDAAIEAGRLSNWLQERQNIPRLVSEQKFNTDDIRFWDSGGNEFELIDGLPCIVQKQNIMNEVFNAN